jgi:hypothetical protein
LKVRRYAIEQRLLQMRKEDERMRKLDARLAELDARLSAIVSNSSVCSNQPPATPDKPEM